MTGIDARLAPALAERAAPALPDSADEAQNPVRSMS
ncbi:hypothetical protein BCEP27_90004 [Burkholderia cepacia]